MNLRRLAMGAVAALAIAGCGSTVTSVGTSIANGADEGLGLGATSPGGSAGTTEDGSGSASQPGDESSAAPTSTDETAVAEPSTTSVPGGSSTATAPSVGQGFTASTILLGVSTSGDANSLGGTFGIKGTSTSGDPLAQMQAVAGDINKHGGLLGRKIVLVAHDFNAEQALTDPAAANQAACADWTQDHKVFAIINPQIVEGTLLECAAKTRTPIIAGGGLDYPLHYAGTYAKYPLFFNIAQMPGDRFDALAIGRLAARGYFAPWNADTGAPAKTGTAKFGYIGIDDADGANQIASVTKQLAAHGIKPAVVIRCPRAVQQTITCQSSAVLKMRSAGVTHIAGAGVPFMDIAQQQGYHPRYYLSVEPALFAVNVGPKQLTGAMGEGYNPSLDVDAGQDPGPPSIAATKCAQVMASIGQAAVSSDRSTLWSQRQMCDTFFFVKAAVDKVGFLGSAALKTGLERLGTSVPSAITWKTLLSPTSHASAIVLRDIDYNPSTRKFFYVDKTNHGEGA